MNFDHPAFAPYRDLIAALDLERALPAPDTLNRVAAALGISNARGLPLRFFEPPGRMAARAYETHILETGAVPTRTDCWHDALNALVWLRFPRFKAALNQAHGAAMAAEREARRGRRRDALTVLDESGVWVASAEPRLPQALREHAWERLFWSERGRVEREMRFVVVGHALLEKLLAPYPSITGKCLILAASPHDDLEAHAVSALQEADSPALLPPLPVQGVPGWDPANADPAYYANREIFRPRPAAKNPAATG